MIRMRTMSSSVSVTALELLRGFPSVSMLHTVTRYLSKPFSASFFDSLASSSSLLLLSLAPSDQFWTETTSFLTTILWLIVDSTHSSAFFNVTLNSSMMFSSLFTVVQSSEPHCPQCLAWAALTTSSSASQPHHQYLSLTSCSRTPAILQCTLPVSSLVTRHLFVLILT